MGNASPKGQSHDGPTGCNPLMSPEKKLLQEQNDINSKQRIHSAPPRYINGDSEKKVSLADEKSLVVTDSKPQANGRSVSPHRNGNLDRTAGDGSSSKPSSRTGTPNLSRKPLLNNKDATVSANDSHRSNSSGSLKDSQAKDIMISYSHLDKEIMLKLKGRFAQLLMATSSDSHRNAMVTRYIVFLYPQVLSTPP